jgi:hypothetical protein
MTFLCNDQERRMFRGVDPAQLRQRMLDRDEPEAEASVTSDFDLLSALHEMDDADRMVAMQLIPDDDVRRIVGLIPVFLELQGMPREELVRLLDGGDE